nr:hypothetical protein [Xanthomonas vasicola]
MAAVRGWTTQRDGRRTRRLVSQCCHRHAHRVVFADLYLPDDMALTVFASIERSDDGYNHASLRRLAVNQQSDFDKSALGHSKVLLHRRAKQEVCVGDSGLLLGRHFIGLQPFDDDDRQEELEDGDNGAGMSQQLGRPCWLQDPIHARQRYYFLAQFVESELRRKDPGIDGIFGGGAGYLFADQRAKKLGEGDAAGISCCSSPEALRSAVAGVRIPPPKAGWFRSLKSLAIKSGTM